MGFLTFDRNLVIVWSPISFRLSASVLAINSIVPSLLNQERDVCKCVAFAEKGALRPYRVNEDGSEHIVLFAPDGSFMTDLYSFLTNEASSYNIDTIEDSELVLITRSASDELRKISPKHQEFIFRKPSDAYTQLEKRITSIISLSLDEPYKELTAHYPGIIQRVPQHMIAS